MYKLKIIIISVTLIFYSSLVKGQTHDEKRFATKGEGFPESLVLDSLFINGLIRGRASFKVIIGYDGEAKFAELIRSNYKDSYLDSVCMDLLMNMKYNTPYEISEGEDYYRIITVVNRKLRQSIIYGRPKPIDE